MTFNHEIHLINRDFPFFSDWVEKNRISLFQNTQEDEEGHIPRLEDKIYVLMKNLHQDYKTILLMNSKERDTYFKLEIDLMKLEIEERKKFQQ